MGVLWSNTFGSDAATIFKSSPKDKGSILTGEAIIDGNDILVPLSMYEEIGPYEITSNQYKTKYFIRMPIGRVQKEKITFDTYGAAEVIQAPLLLVNDMPYFNITRSPYLGLKGTRLQEDIVLEQTNHVEVPTKEEINKPIALTFDPLIEGTTYERVQQNNMTSIMSPSLFELTEKGVRASSKLSPSYVYTYNDRGYQVWPLITNQFDPQLTHRILKAEHMWTHYSNILINYALAYNFKGYNFDFEDINYEDKEQLKKFVTYLSDQMRPYNMYTSIDVTGYSNSENWSLVYDREAYGKAVDYVVLMAYDETWSKSTVAGPVASYPWVRDNLTKLLKEVPSHKVILGIPFYMRSWSIPVNGKWEGKAKGKTLSMIDANRIQKQFSQDVVWNPNLRLHYVELVDKNGQYATINENRTTSPTTITNTNTNINTHGEKNTEKSFKGTIVKIWFEDVDSLKEKVQLSKEFSLAGLGAWRKGFEDVDTWESIRSQFDMLSNKKKKEIYVESVSHEGRKLSKEEKRALKKEQERLRKEEEKLKKEQERLRKEEEKRLRKEIEKQMRKEAEQHKRAVNDKE